MAENRGIAKGVFTQWLGSGEKQATYMSKKLDLVTAGLPACLWIVAVVAVLFKDANKLVLRQHLTVTAPHALESILDQPLN